MLERATPVAATDMAGAAHSDLERSSLGRGLAGETGRFLRKATDGSEAAEGALEAAGIEPASAAAPGRASTGLAHRLDLARTAGW